MIIPPDPEKDPRLFSASSSTPSLLLPPPEESDIGTDVEARRNGAFGNYALSRDDLGVGAYQYQGEFLPPYERKAKALAGAVGGVDHERVTGAGVGAGAGGDQAEQNIARLGGHGQAGQTPTLPMRERPRQPGYIGITIPHHSHSRLVDTGSDGSITPTTSSVNAGASASTSRLPFHHHHHHTGGSAGGLSPATTLGPDSSTTKLWESSSSTLASGSGGVSGQEKRDRKGKGKARAFLCIPTRLPWSSSSSDQTHRTDRFDSTSTPDSSNADNASKWKRRWKKYKRPLLCLLIFALIGLGLMIGLLAGFRQNLQYKSDDRGVAANQNQNGPAWHDVEPGDSRWNMAWADGSMNLTWTAGRDSPPNSDGNLTSCNLFSPFNASDPSTNFSSLSTPYPSNKLWVSTHYIPLQRVNMTGWPYTYLALVEDDADVVYGAGNKTGGANRTGTGTASSGASATMTTARNNTSPGLRYKTNSTTTSNTTTYRLLSNNTSTPLPLSEIQQYPLGLLTQLPIYSRGIASSGTVEFVGRDAAQEVISGGEEGAVRIDIVVQYGGVQGVEGIMRVCETVRGDGSVGVGVYTPIQTDGKITNPYTLDPTQLPSFHIIVRFPPSLFSSSSSSSSPPAVSGNTRPIYISDLLMRLDKMGVRVGDLTGIAQFGNWNLTSGRGGAVVDYVAAQRVWVQTAENAVRGRFNVSKSLYINSTDSSILADVILHDPFDPFNATLPRNSLTSRGIPGEASASALPDPHAIPPATASSANLASTISNGTSSGLANNFTHTVNTTFHTTDGFIRVRYISHPPQTALSSWISLASGEMDISLHPNYVGPFALKNAWGSVRIPRPKEGIYDDPQGKGRQRVVVQGVINIEDGSLFQRGGLNSTLLPQSGTTVTGAAYWQAGGANGTLSPQAVQASEEGRRGNQMVLLGGWGDVTLRADGS